MRYVATALIAFIALGACTEPEPGRQILAPTAATNCRDATLLAVDTTIDYNPLPGAFPARLTRSLPALPKGGVDRQHHQARRSKLRYRHVGLRNWLDGADRNGL